MDISFIIAENLKRLRMERNLSFGQLSELTGVSKVMISQMERGATNPSINTIWKLANGLQVPYTALLEPHISGGAVINKIDLIPQELDENKGLLYCYYRTSPNRNFELFEMKLEEGSSYTSLGHGERTEEYILVQGGILKMEVNKEIHILKKGDAISFPASSQHIYHNEEKEVLVLFIINYYI